MPNWFDRLVGKQDPPPESDPLSQDSQEQALRLRLAEMEDRLRQLGAELERARAGEADQQSARLSAERERLAESVAGPAVQLLTQVTLIEKGQPVAMTDVAGVARRLLRALEAHGVSFTGQPGENTRFDPLRHAPLDANISLTPGEAVVIKLAGVSSGARVMRKALVERSRV